MQNTSKIKITMLDCNMNIQMWSKNVVNWSVSYSKKIRLL